MYEFESVRTTLGQFAMEPDSIPDGIQATVARVLGYLNFSSGTHDPQFHQSLNELYRAAETTEDVEEGSAARRAVAGAPPRWRMVAGWLRRGLEDLRRTSETFAEAAQATAALDAIDDFVAGTMSFHRDLLFHQTEDSLFGPFFLGGAWEAILQQGPPWEPDGRDAALASAIRAFNDFVGYRPVPTLEWQRLEPRPHEWVRPVPLYLEHAGVARSPYQDVVEAAIAILQQTDADLCEAVWFVPSLLKELAMDPRAYDFDHPVNRRPNYHFGEWDPHCIDNKGNYRRFVVREVTLQALSARIEDASRLRIPSGELFQEAAAVLAGTILMSSAITGSGPGTHDSNTTLVKLIPRIAACRDAFYERLLERLSGAHAVRLRRETKALQQPFGGARQHLNMYLARQRASQLEHVRLAKVFARMGYLHAAQRQSDAVPVASARILCRIDCGLTACYHALRANDRPLVVQHLDRIVDLLHRGIDCGAIVDPWNILGFDAQFSLFPALENSVRDHRVDDLLRVLDRIFDVLGRLWSDAAAAADAECREQAESRYDELATWWNRFAAHEVKSVESEPPMEGLRAARAVADALGRWNQAGASTGDVSFWAPHVQGFDSPKPYALVVETLLARGDYVSSMSLLVHWLGKSGEVPLERRASSFHDLVLRWVRHVGNRLLTDSQEVVAAPGTSRASVTASEDELLCKFFDFLEANAEASWDVPSFSLSAENTGGTELDKDSPRPSQSSETSDDEDVESGDENLFGAAYEDVVYRGSTEDGLDSDLADSREPTSAEEELDQEAHRCQDRLLFLHTLARAWSEAGVVLAQASRSGNGGRNRERIEQSLEAWHARAADNCRELLRLMDQVDTTRLKRFGTDVEAMARYDRQRMLKESILEQIILTCVRTAAAELVLKASLAVVRSPAPSSAAASEFSSAPAHEHELDLAAAIIAAALREDRAEAANLSGELVEFLRGQQILYSPLARGGSPRQIALIRIRQQYLQYILTALPRLGLVRLTLELIETVRIMEHNIPAGHGAVTQFDDMFEVGFREMVEVLVRSTDNRTFLAPSDDQDADTILISCLEQLTEHALGSWLQHSQTLRLSVLERVRGAQPWKQLVEFVEKYGDEIFTQEFLYLSNIRAILHCGTESWLEDVQQDPEFEERYHLLRAAGRELDRGEAAERLSLILEAVAENYDEYRDFNSTTTQSDRGDKIYVLLDFLRLRCQYDRVAWNLRPVILSHRVLVRSGRTEAAQLWRRILHERLGAEADRFQKKLLRLQKRYAVQMGSVAQRIGERFLQPMTIDRMQSLLGPAIDQLHHGLPPHAFEILEDEAELLMRNPQGSGVNVPKWLEALEDEAELYDPALGGKNELRGDDAPDFHPGAITLEELQEQLADDE